MMQDASSRGGPSPYHRTKWNPSITPPPSIPLHPSSMPRVAHHRVGQRVLGGRLGGVVGDEEEATGRRPTLPWTAAHYPIA